MPSVNVALYFSEEEYVIYLEKKEEIHNKVREIVKELIKKKEEA